MPVDLMVLGAALLTGLLGGAHCAAMCGGIATGLSVGSRGWWAALQPTLGRVAGYVLAGLRLLDQRGRLPRFAGGPGARLWSWLRPLQRRLLPADTAGKRVLVGMLWGWMPCGLSTTLLAAAWLQASATHGALTMAAFGLGTLPVMVPLTWAGARFGQRLQRGAYRTGAGVLVIASGLLTIAAPWLMRLPAMHGVLEALGCRSLPV